METTLIHNECVSLTRLENTRYFIVREDVEGNGIATTARSSSGLEITPTAKLQEFLTLSGVETKLDFGKSLCGGYVNIGFDYSSLSSTSKSYKACVESPGSGTLKGVIGREFLKKNTVMLRMNIETLKNHATGLTLQPQVISHLFTLRDLYDHQCDICVVFTRKPVSAFYSDMNFQNEWIDANADWKLTMSLSLIIHPMNGPDQGVTDKFAFAKKMLENEFLCDVTIIPGCGTPVKCHRSVLAAHSTVFKAMFGGNTKEFQTGEVQVPSMTKEGVRGMLAYLYGWNTETAQENPIVCVELLEVSDKYDVRELENSMKNLLMDMHPDWYSAEASLRLVLFLKDKDFTKLKMKAMQVFKWKFDEIKKLSAYQELFKEGPDVLMGVVSYLASI